MEKFQRLLLTNFGCCSTCSTGYRKNLILIHFSSHLESILLCSPLHSFPWMNGPLSTPALLFRPVCDRVFTLWIHAPGSHSPRRWGFIYPGLPGCLARCLCIVAAVGDPRSSWVYYRTLKTNGRKPRFELALEQSSAYWINLTRYFLVATGLPWWGLKVDV